MDITIPLPAKLVWEPSPEGQHKGKVTISPCYPGYGITLGNALRRVMLSSLPGAAIYAIKIKGVQHEFSTIPHVKEDIVEIILNLKRVRLKLFSDEPIKLSLKAKGEKKVKAGDIEKNSQVEIVNPDLCIATITDAAGLLEADIWVKKGIGYVPTESMDDKESLEVGAIAIDSIFTPIRNVGFNISNVRVGGRTDFDKLEMNIETDGTLTAWDALDGTSDILMDQFKFIKANAASEEKENSGS